MASAATTSHSQNANQRRNTYAINKPGQLNESNQQVSSFQSQSSTSQQHIQHQQRSNKQQQSLDQNGNYLDMSNSNHYQHQLIGHNSTQYHQQNTFYLKQQQLQQQQMYNSNDQNNSHAAKSHLMYRNAGNSRASANAMTVESFTLNTLVWAKLNNFPWWPCKIVRDSNNEFSKIIDNTQMYFIEFFGPLNERAWLSCHSIFTYKGIESFKIYAQDQVDRATSKAAKEKLAERFQLKVALNRRDQWEVAIEQADMYLKTSETAHDVNSVYSKAEKSGRAANLADSLARLNQLNEEKINAKNAGFNQPKRKRDQQHLQQMQQLQHQQQYTKKNNQDEFFSGHELSIQKQYLEEQSLKHKKQRKLQKNSQESQMFIDHQQQNQQHQQQFHSIESIRHERSYTKSEYTSYPTNANQLKSTATESQRLQDIYNSKQLSKKKNQIYDMIQQQQQEDQQQQEELISNHENQNEDSDQQSQNSGSSSDEDNDSLFQPTSIFEYDTEQPNQMLGAGTEVCSNVSMSKNYQMDQGDMANQSINSIVNEIKNSAKMNKNGYYEDTESQEYNIVNNFITSDSEEEEKIDKNDTEWSNTSFKSAKRKSGPKLVTKKTSGKYNSQQKMFCQEANNSKKLFDSKLNQQQMQTTGGNLVKKKRGRKPKYAINESTAFANDENKTQFLQQQTHQHDSVEPQQQQQQTMYIKNDGQKMYQKICVSSNNSSRRTSDTSSTLSATSEDEVFESKSGDLNKHHNLVLMEDNSVLNQSEINKICKKSLKIKTTSAKPKSQTKKRNSKSTSSITGSITGLSEFSTMEQINQMAELDYNQFVDENSTNLTNIQHQQHATGQNNSDNAAMTTSTEQNPATSNSTSTAETYLIDRYKYAVRHIRQGLSVEEACNKYRISKGALLKCLSGGTAPRGKKTRLTESEENEIVEWLINNKDLKYNEAIHLVFEQVEKIFELAQRPNPFNNGKPSMDWWYDFLSRHPQIMASKPDWLMRGKVNDQYIKDVQSGQLKCTKFRRALLSAIQYIRSLNDAQAMASSSTQASSSSICNRSPLSSSSNNGSNKAQNTSANSSFKIAPGLSNRIEKNDMAKTSVAAGPRQNKMTGQKSTSYKSSLLKQQRKSSVQMSSNKMTLGSDQMEIENIKEEIDEQVPSPTSLDTRIFNADNLNNSTNNNSYTGANSSSSSNNINYFNINHRQKNMLSETARPIKNEKSIQDSLEYLYEQNNNFINEISNINQLMDGKNNNSSGNSDAAVTSEVGRAGVSDTDPNSRPANSNQKNQFYDASKQVDNSFDNFLDQALNSSNHQDNFDDLMETKIVDNSNLPMGVGNSNISASPTSNLNVNGSTCSSIIEDLVSGVNDSGYVNQSFNSAGDENYFQPGFNQTNYFNNVPTSQVFTDLHKKPMASSGKQQQNELNSTFFLNNINENNLLLNSQCGFENFTQSQPFNTKLDFTPKNHLLVQDDDDDNDDDIELVNSILSNTNDENQEETDSMNIVNAIDPSGFLP